MTGDLFAFGDVRDVVVQGRQLVLGEEADQLVLGLAAIGLGGHRGNIRLGRHCKPRARRPHPVQGRAKKRAPQLGLTDWARRSATEGRRFQYAAPGGRQRVVTRPLESLGRGQGGGRTEKAGLLVAAVKDVGRVGEKAGVRAALDTVKVADNPKDLARPHALPNRRAARPGRS